MRSASAALGVALGLVTLATGAACGESNGTPSGADAGSLDASTDATGDATGSDLFSIRGACGELDVELTSQAPSDFANAMEFTREYTDDDLDTLSAGGQEIVRDGNLGGSSLLSEVFAFENLAACEAAELLKTESEIVYVIEGTKTDFTARIGGVTLGVSVVRAQTFPLGTDMTVGDAQARLEDKLGDILESTANVSAADAWTKQVLAVLVYNQQHADALAAALPMIDAGTRADSIVWLTVTDGPDEPIYD